jgi:ribosomal protein S18 acetylase RimI-like enzyme
VTIRLATEADVEPLQRLWAAFQDEIGGPAFLREAWDDAWIDLKRHIGEELAFVPEEDGVLVGFVFATIPRETPDLGHVTDLYVSPEARRRGIARTLIRRIGDALSERGVNHVGLDVRVDNVAARTFYDRLGFVEQERFLTNDVATMRERADTARGDRRSRGSTHVQTDDEAAVERALAKFLPRLGRSTGSEVTPARNGWVTIYDQLCDEDRAAHRRLGAELSDRLGVPVIALRLEEEAVVRFFLFERGRMVDEYLSVPTYYGELNKADELSLAANPTLVARLTGADPAQVRTVARTAHSLGELPPAPKLLTQIAELLGLTTTIAP